MNVGDHVARNAIATDVTPRDRTEILKSVDVDLVKEEIYLQRMKDRGKGGGELIKFHVVRTNIRLPQLVSMLFRRLLKQGAEDVCVCALSVMTLIPRFKMSKIMNT